MNTNKWLSLKKIYRRNLSKLAWKGILHITTNQVDIVLEFSKTIIAVFATVCMQMITLQM